MLESPNLLFSLKLLLMAPHRFLLRLEDFCAGHLFFRKLADGLFLKCCKETAEKYPDIEFNNVIIDNASMQVVSNPWQFDVMVMPNLYGNILGKFGCLTCCCCCCCLPDPFRGMGAWRKTMEPQKPGNSPGSGPEVIKRQRVAKE